MHPFIYPVYSSIHLSIDLLNRSRLAQLNKAEARYLLDPGSNSGGAAGRWLECFAMGPPMCENRILAPPHQNFWLKLRNMKT
eukprot:scaffold511534_cov20-Prasinocladus_malaysianus.AAC.1